jgi:hypothetical protein
MHKAKALGRALLLAIALQGCASAPQVPADRAFALMGDFPYSQAQANLLDDLIEQLNREPLAFAVHVGDITSGQGPCSDAWLGARASSRAAGTRSCCCRGQRVDRLPPRRLRSAQSGSTGGGACSAGP